MQLIKINLNLEQDAHYHLNISSLIPDYMLSNPNTFSHTRKSSGGVYHIKGKLYIPIHKIKDLKQLSHKFLLKG
jgi:hypothetical protein